MQTESSIFCNVPVASVLSRSGGTSARLGYQVLSVYNADTIMMGEILIVAETASVR